MHHDFMYLFNNKIFIGLVVPWSFWVRKEYAFNYRRYIEALLTFFLADIFFVEASKIEK